MGILAVDDIDTIGKIDLLSDHPIKAVSYTHLTMPTKSIV